jgi:hypothetical protein
VKGSFYEELECVFDKPTIGNESLLEISNDNGIRVINLATSKIPQSKVRCSHITTSISILGHLQMGNPTVRLIII